MASVALIYPPFVSENRAFPPLSLPALAAYLRGLGNSVNQIDANIRLYRWMTASDRLNELKERLEHQRRNHREPFASYADVERYCFLTDALAGWLPYIMRTLQCVNGDLSLLDGTRCLYLLDRLEALLLLEAGVDVPAIQLSSEELFETLRRARGSLLASFLIDQIVPDILSEKPRLIGLSLMVEQQLLPALMLADAIREIAPDVHITCGGGLISAISDKLGSRSKLCFTVIDSFVCFDGEHAIRGLLEALEGTRELESVPNLVFLQHSTDSVIHTAIEETGPLDCLPRPDFSGIDMSLYTRSILPYYVSKGCSYGRCAYCSDPAYSSARNRSPKCAVDEIDYLVQQHNVRTLLFVDSYINPNHMMPIAEEMTRRGIKVNWAQQTRMDRFLTTEAIEIYAKSGCTELWFGMETINDRMIRLIRKGSKESIIRRILSDCCDRGIRVTLNCMIGFPTETLEEARETMAFIERLSNSYPKLVFKCNTGFVFVPRLSAFGANPRAFGIDILEEFEWSPRLEWIPPEWRFRNEFRTLDGQMFEKSYAGAASLRRRGAGTDAPRFSPGTRLRLSDGCYLHNDPRDIVALWRTIFSGQTQMLEIQRQDHILKTESRRVIDAAKTLEANSLPHGNALHFAYVIDDGSWRRIFPLSPIYSLILSHIPSASTIGALTERIRVSFAGEDTFEIARAVAFAVETLALCNIVEVEDHTVIASSNWSPHIEPRHNLGSTSNSSDALERNDVEQPPALIQIDLTTH